MAKIYLASSWRNTNQPTVLKQLRAAGYSVYDFKDEDGFHWSDIDPNWRSWTTEEYREALNHPLAHAGFNRDFAAMQWADTFVLLHPCGRSAHLELGWAAGAGKKTAILQPEEIEPELMAGMVDYIAGDINEILGWLRMKDAA